MADTTFDFGNVITGGALEFVSKVTISADATIDVVGIEAGFDYIFALQNVLPATDLVSLSVRTSTDGGSTYDAGADYTTDAGATESQIVVSPSTIGNAAGEGISVDVLLHNPADTEHTYVTSLHTAHRGTTITTTGIAGGKRNSAADVDAIRFLFSSGNLASGNLIVWRRKRSAGSVSSAAVAVSFVSETVISAVAQVDVTGLETGFDYIFVFQNALPVTDAVRLEMRTSSDGGSTFDAGVSDYADETDAAESSMNVGNDMGNAVGEGVSGHIELYNPGDATVQTHVTATMNAINTAGVPTSIILGGKRNAAALVDAARFFFESGNMASGNLTVYKRSRS